MKQQEAYSFGVIPLFKKEGIYHILLIKNSKGGHWGLPKGTPEDNETPMETALREMEEETGIIKEQIKIEATPIFTEKYSFEQNSIIYNKTNTYYIAHVNEMFIGKNLDEISEARWVSINEAKDIITHTGALNLIQDIENYLA